MISDAEFWMEVRRSQGGGDAIFRSMLALLHARQVRNDARTTNLDKEEFTLVTNGKARRDLMDGKCPSSEEKKAAKALAEEKERKFKEMEKPLEMNKSLQLNVDPPLPGPPRRVATITIRVLQQIMLFAVPIYALRYNIPAMSMSWNTSCFIDRASKQLITFGAGTGVKVPQALYGRGCVAGDGFFAILSDADEVWASGGLKVASSTVSGLTPLGREETMTGIAARILMLVGHGQRLATVTRAFTVRSLSALSTPTRSIVPSRHIRFLDLGYGEDYYMIGTDSVVYKTTASMKAVSTPRRVMTLSRMPVSRISSGTNFLLIIDQNGHLYTMGRNRKGQLGNGEKSDARRKPYHHDRLNHHFFTQVAAGDCHSLALTSSGIVYGAGSNESGQLGLGMDRKEALTFTRIPLPDRCVGIAAGPAGSMFALENSMVLSCGLNDCMQLGVGSAHKIVYEPTPIEALENGVESYTMEFGGYRRPDPSSSSSNEAVPDAVPPAGESGAGGATDAAVRGGDLPTAPRPSGGGKKGGAEGEGIQRSNSLLHNDATVVTVASQPSENHEPANEPTPSRAGAGGKKGSKSEKKPGAGGKADGSCKCCAVM